LLGFIMDTKKAFLLKLIGKAASNLKMIIFAD